MKVLEILKNIDKIRDREYSIAFKDGWNSFSKNKQNCDFTIRHKEVVKLTNDDFTSKAIAELEAYITNYQGIKRRLDKALETLNTMNIKSCEKCKKWVGNAPFKGFCSVTGSTIDLGGCNDYFEPKG